MIKKKLSSIYDFTNSLLVTANVIDWFDITYVNKSSGFCCLADRIRSKCNKALHGRRNIERQSEKSILKHFNDRIFLHIFFGINDSTYQFGAIDNGPIEWTFSQGITYIFCRMYQLISNSLFPICLKEGHN